MVNLDKNLDKNDLERIGFILLGYIERKFGESNGTLDSVLDRLGMSYSYFVDLHEKIVSSAELSSNEFIDMTNLLQALNSFNKVIDDVLEEHDVDMSGEYFDEMLNNMKMMIKNGNFTIVD